MTNSFGYLCMFEAYSSFRQLFINIFCIYIKYVYILVNQMEETMTQRERYNLQEAENVVRELTYNNTRVAELSCRYYVSNVYRVEGGNMESGTYNSYREMTSALRN